MFLFTLLHSKTPLNKCSTVYQTFQIESLPTEAFGESETGEQIISC